MPEISYNLDARKLYQLLKKKKVEFLYHVNTVSTSATFIEQRAVLSRGLVESKGLFQTEQKSDDKDKKFNVWDSVFTDGEDLHARYKQANKYGPVLFKLKLELLLSPEFPIVKVTRKNPLYWKDKIDLDKRFYSNFEEIEADYLSGRGNDSNVMFTFPKPSNKIKLNKYLDIIVVDDPNLIVKEKQKVGPFMVNYLKNKMKENGLGHIDVVLRVHQRFSGICWCGYNYKRLKDQEFKRLWARKEKFLNNA